MKVVVDTNILVSSISKKSSLRWVFNAFINEKFTLCVTTEILAEYEEILQRFFGNELASIVLQIIENAVNVEFVTTYYAWMLIKSDPDDNKFVDCAIAANAKYIISNDKHFKALNEVEFPQMEVIGIGEFLKTILEE